MLNDYLADYLTYASENEAPLKLHKWAGLSTLAIALSRRVWLDYAKMRIYPNLYVFLVGSPASGKSYAMKLGAKVVHAFTNISIAPDSITAQSLVDTMCSECKQEIMLNGKMELISPVTILSNELVSLLGPEPKPMIDLLTDIYDNGPTYKHKTISRGSKDVPQPCVNIMGCLTPAFLDAVLTQKLVTGGFTRRMLIVYASERRPANPWPEDTVEHEDAKQRCISYAKLVQQLVGPFTISPSAKDLFCEWYRVDKDPKMRQATGVMQEYFGALNITVLKLAILFSVNESLDKIVDTPHIEAAIRELDDLEKDILHVIGGGGRNELAPITRAIERCIIDHPHGIQARRIKFLFMNDAKDDEIDKILTHLRDVDAVRYDVINGHAIYHAIRTHHTSSDAGAPPSAHPPPETPLDTTSKDE